MFPTPEIMGMQLIQIRLDTPLGMTQKLGMEGLHPTKMDDALKPM